MKKLKRKILFLYYWIILNLKKIYRWITRDSKLAVGLVVYAYDKGGLEQVVHNLYKYYRKKGVKAYILVETTSVGYMADQLNDLRHMRIYQGDYIDFLKFCNKNDITHIHYNYNDFRAESIKKFGFRTIYTIHNLYTWLSDSEFTIKVNRLNKIDSLIAVSECVKSYYCRRGCVNEESVVVINNGVDFTEFDRGDDCNIDRRVLGIEEDDIVLGNLASFYRQKHHSTMIGAMEMVTKINPKIKLVFVGNIGDMTYYNKIVQLLDSSSAKDNIIISPYVKYNELKKYIEKNIDVSIFTSFYEGFGNATLDALHCGLPLIISDTGIAEEAMKFASGVMVRTAFNPVDLTFEKVCKFSEIKECPNTKEIADAILEVVNNIDVYKHKAREVAFKSNDFTSENMGENYYKLLLS